MVRKRTAPGFRSVLFVSCTGMLDLKQGCLIYGRVPVDTAMPYVPWRRSGGQGASRTLLLLRAVRFLHRYLGPHW